MDKFSSLFFDNFFEVERSRLFDWRAKVWDSQKFPLDFRFIQIVESNYSLSKIALNSIAIRFLVHLRWEKIFLVNIKKDMIKRIEIRNDKLFNLIYCLRYDIVNIHYRKYF